jgi:hypothetical protein
MHTEFIAVRSGITLGQAFGEISRAECVIALVTTDGSLHAEQVVGVLNPFNLTRAMATASEVQRAHRA